MSDGTPILPRFRNAAEIATTQQGPRPLPALGDIAPLRLPDDVSHTSGTGLQMVAAYRPSSPLVELRLRIPFGGRNRNHAARAELLAETIVSGTGSRTQEQIDVELALVGGHLDASVTPQRLLLSGSVLASGLDTLLQILGDVLTDAIYDEPIVRREQERLVEHLLISNAQPGTIARNVLLRQRFGSHPAIWEIPDYELVGDLSAAAVRQLHKRAVLPAGSSLLLVGDIAPEKALQQAEKALENWSGEGSAQKLSAPPACRPGTVVAHHRDGFVQSMTRLSAPAVSRTDPQYPAYRLANIIFGGYFSSRLVENLREVHGYTYHAFSQFEFWPGLAALTIGYDTTTEVSAAALLETRYELGRMAVDEIATEEIAAARNYALGVLASSLSTQAGYASMCSTLLGYGLEPSWLATHWQGLATVSPDDIIAAGRQLCAPTRSTGVIVGDLDKIGADLLRLGNVTIVQ